jgi:hypothetical protein
MTMTLLALLFACTGADPDTADTDLAVDPPSMSFLSPTDGATVPAGDIAVAVVVNAFTLEDPAKHNDGAPEGYLSVSVDGAAVLTTKETNFTLTITDAGAHTIGAELLYADGDALEPDPVSAEIGITVE